MFTNDHGINNFQQLFQEVKKYVDLQKDYIKLELTEKLTAIFSALILGLLIVLLSIVILFYLSLSLAHLLAPHVGGLSVAYLIIAGIVILLIVLLYVLRKSLIINPIVNFLANLFLNDSND